MSGKIISEILCLMLLSVACSIISGPVLAMTGTEDQITTNTADQFDPAISGPYIVYTDSRYGNKDIFLYDLLFASESDLTPGTPTDQYLDDVGGTYVVYTNIGASGSDIFLFDTVTSSSTPLTSGGSHYSPAVEGDHVVWVSATVGTQNVILADVNLWTLQQITTNPAELDAPRVDGDWVVWEELVGDWRQIRAYRISTGETRTITSGAADHKRPDVSGNFVVWSENSAGNWDIYSYSLSDDVTTQVTFDPDDQQFPRISGNRVVWEDGQTGITQIWTLDFDEGLAEQLSPSSHPQMLNAIDGNRVVWTEPRYGNFDIFMFTINHRPDADAGPDQAVGAGEVVVLDASASFDPDGNPLTYAWTITGQPAGSLAALSDPAAVNPSFVADLAGDYVIRLVVNDGKEDSDPAMVIVAAAAAANHPPVLDAIGAKSIDEGQELLITISATDPDGDELTYSVSNLLPAGALFDSVMRTFDWTPGYESAGVYMVNFSVTDGKLGDFEHVDVTVMNVNRIPVADAGDDQPLQIVGSVVYLDGSESSDPDNDPITYAWTVTAQPAGSLAALSDPAAVNPTFTADLAGDYIISLVVSDGLADSDPATVSVYADTINHPPVAVAGPDKTVSINEVVMLDGSASSDPDDDPITYTWTMTARPAGSSAALTDPAAINPAFTADKTGEYIIRLVVNDGLADSDPSIITVTAENTPPVVGAISAPESPITSDTIFTASASFTDPDVMDIHTAAWDWGDGTTTAGTVSESDGSGTVSDMHAYASPGVYTIHLEVTDLAGATGTSVYTFVVVYDPAAGFVTGGGWIESPPGAYTPEDDSDSDLTGPAHFGFIAGYKKGSTVPEGNTQFRLKAADMDFRSTEYQYLVIAGARAQYKGSGMVNDEGNYGFILSAVDGQLHGGGGGDTFRIKIWDKSTGTILYDNQVGAPEDAAPSTEIAGGSIQIHE